jgi:hypothetical protein
VEGSLRCLVASDLISKQREDGTAVGADSSGEYPSFTAELVSLKEAPLRFCSNSLTSTLALDVQFPPLGAAQPGYISHITVDRITGVGPWAS